LRRQVRPGLERPLVVITPKSLLRLPAAASALTDFTSGGFQPLLDDPVMKSSEAVNRVVLCSGKVYYDLAEARKKSPNSGSEHVAIIRMEQFYPFPLKRLREVLAKYPAARQLVWAQEEPKNMGGWTFVEQRLENLLPACERPIYVGRAPSASPATGSYAIHQAEQARLLAEALNITA
jgi:2-oxoglutarate dehydrogenase complex dehydrogenase (E1) component-like enzyme